jgi:hypothetical protein
MEVLKDTTETKIVHTRVIELSNAPRMTTNNFYTPDELWQADELLIEWEDGTEPVRVIAKGYSDGRVRITRSYGMGHMPMWMAKVVNPESVREPDLIVRVNPREVISVPKPDQDPAPLAKPKLVRKKVADKDYDIYTEDGKLVGNVKMTGEYSRDDYPWSWYVTDELVEQLKEAGAPDRKSGGSSESLRGVVDVMATSIAKYGLKP